MRELALHALRPLPPPRRMRAAAPRVPHNLQPKPLVLPPYALTNMSDIRRKLVIVGDGACGKTCLLIMFSKVAFPEVYVPTQVKNTTTASDPSDSYAILIRFAVYSPDSLDNIQETWISEVMHFCAGLPIIVGKTSQRPLNPEEGLTVAQKIGAKHYLECSVNSSVKIKTLWTMISARSGAAIAVERLSPKRKAPIPCPKPEAPEPKAPEPEAPKPHSPEPLPVL
ncbi:hypothetical protein D9615_010535 [Tricholomella constricta]|uniref:Uncharacterized protein n=1 Tax=Tricholomella constricta TaxID=117010 RepID=A0A8H5GLD3_9AGAR|nr:hypothetical protein D9615_010535 [Tricholomella constricta]